MSPLVQAAQQLQAVLNQETAAARRASLPELTELMEAKRDALAELEAAGPAATAAERDALRAMLAVAEENALVLGAVAGAMEAVQDRLRTELAAAADPGTYQGAGGPRRPLRHTLAASVNRTV